MTNCPASQRILASALALLLVSCGTTRHAFSPSTEELTDFVLVIEEEPNGQAVHSWLRATEINLSQFVLPSHARSQPGSIVFASRRPRDCDQEHIACYQACMKRRLPSSHSHIQRQDGSKSAFCARECLEKFQECQELEKARGLEFLVAEDAVEWLKQHRKEILIGTVVIIAGVAFVTLSAGAGAVLLAPLVLVAG